MSPLVPVQIPGLFVAGAHQRAGKTVVAGAIAHWFRRNRASVAVCKPVATGCVRRREGLVSEDAELLARWAEANHPLDLISPVRLAEKTPPAIVLRSRGEPMDWDSVARSLRLMSRDNDVLVVEGNEGVMCPLDDSMVEVDLIKRLALPVVLVTEATEMNPALMSIDVLRSRGLSVTGIVINRYPTDTPGSLEEAGPREIARVARLPILCHVPREPVLDGILPPGVVSAVSQVDWWRFSGGRR